MHLVDDDERATGQRVDFAAKPGGILGVAEKHRFVREIDVQARAKAPADRRLADLPRPEQEHAAPRCGETARQQARRHRGLFTT